MKKKAKMNPEVKAKWLTALRGGFYNQGHGTLRKDDAHCCLGVLCDVVSPTGWIEGSDDEDGVYHFEREGHSENAVTDELPPDLAKEVGLPSTDPMVPITAFERKLLKHSTALPDHRKKELDGMKTARLSALNDSHLFNFAQIAAKIEAHL